MGDDRVAAFHRLHSSGCFVMPNPWDAGSARALEQIGFKALATTSAGFAWTLGRADNQVTLDEALEHLRVVADAVKVPVNADFEGGFAVDPEQVDANVKLAAARDRRALDRGLHRRRRQHPLYRVRSGRGACSSRATGDRRKRDRRRSHRPVRGVRVSDVPTSTRRSEGCAPTPKPAPTASTLRGSRPSSTSPRSSPPCHPKPVNLLINAPFMTVAEAAALGVRRISVGGTLARTAWAGFLQAAHEIADAGTSPGSRGCRTSMHYLAIESIDADLNSRAPQFGVRLSRQGDL